MKVIDNLSSKARLSEIGHGTITAKFALYNRQTEEVMTPFVQCKDFISDVFWSNKMQKDITIFGFKWKNNSDEGILNKPRLSIAVKKVRVNGVKEEITKEEILGIMALINPIDKANSFTRTIPRLCEDNKHIIVNFDKKWTDIPYTLSAFLLLLRIGFKYDGKSNVEEFYKNVENFLSTNDAMYMRTATSIIKDMQNGYIDSSQTYEQYKEINSVHGSSGIVAYARKYKKPELVGAEQVEVEKAEVEQIVW